MDLLHDKTRFINTVAAKVGGFDPNGLEHEFREAQSQVQEIYNDMVQKLRDLEEKDPPRMDWDLTMKYISEFEGQFHRFQEWISPKGKHGLERGKVLSRLKGSLDRAGELRDLVQYFHEFHNKDQTRINYLLNSSSVDLLKLAQILRRLNGVTKVEFDQHAETIRSITDYCTMFETKMLSMFQQANTSNNMDDLKIYSDILIEFNQGTSLISAYVTEHEFFGRTLVCSDTKAIYHKHSVGPTELDNLDILDPCCKQVYDQIVEVVSQEWIKTGMFIGDFSKQIRLIKLFVQRIFAQPVQAVVDQLLNGARFHGRLAYLSTFFSLHRATRELTCILERITKGTIETGSYLEDVFWTHLQKDKLLDWAKEEHSLLKEMLGLVHIVPPVGKTQRGFLGLYRKRSSRILTYCPTYHGIPLNELELDPDLTIFKAVIQMTDQALKRIEEMGNSGETNKLIDMMVEKVASLAEEKSGSSSTGFVEYFGLGSESPDMSLLMNIIEARKVIELVSSYLGAEKGHLDKFYSDINQKLVTQMEIVFVWFRKMVLNQLTGYTHETLRNSPACMAICRFLVAISRVLDGLVLERMGLGFISILVSNIKSRMFSIQQVINLTNDLFMYQKTIQSLQNPTLDWTFQFVVDLGNLLFVRPENLSAVIRNSSLSTMDVAVLKPFLHSRKDLESADMDALLEF